MAKRLSDKADLVSGAVPLAQLPYKAGGNVTIAADGTISAAGSTGGTTLTQNQVDALNGASSPSAGNVFTTNDNLNALAATVNTKAPSDSPSFTGNVQVPLVGIGASNSNAASTAFVARAVSTKADLVSGRVPLAQLPYAAGPNVAISTTGVISASAPAPDLSGYLPAPIVDGVHQIQATVTFPAGDAQFPFELLQDANNLYIRNGNTNGVVISEGDSALNGRWQLTFNGDDGSKYFAYADGEPLALVRKDYLADYVSKHAGTPPFVPSQVKEVVQSYNELFASNRGEATAQIAGSMPGMTFVARGFRYTYGYSAADTDGTQFSWTRSTLG